MSHQLINNLNALVVGFFALTALGTVATRQVWGCLKLFIIQSLLLALSALLLGISYHSEHLYAVAFVDLISKPIIIPWLLFKVVPAEIHTRREVSQALNIPTALLLSVALVILAYFLGAPLLQAVAPEFRQPNVPIGIAAMLLGAFTMTVRREAVPLLIGLLTMENGAFLSAIAIASHLPMLVELAVAVDGLIVVFIIGILMRAIHQHVGTTAVGDLSTLKEIADSSGGARK